MRTIKVVALVIITVFAISACVPIQASEVAHPAEVQSDTAPQPEPVVVESESDVPRITLEDAKAQFDNGTAVFLDARDEGDYEYAHIAGALSVPYSTWFLPKAAVEESLEDFRNQVTKEQLIITYCT